MQTTPARDVRARADRGPAGHDAHAVRRRRARFGRKRVLVEEAQRPGGRRSPRRAPKRKPSRMPCFTQALTRQPSAARARRRGPRPRSSAVAQLVEGGARLVAQAPPRAGVRSASIARAAGRSAHAHAAAARARASAARSASRVAVRRRAQRQAEALLAAGPCSASAALTGIGFDSTKLTVHQAAAAGRGCARASAKSPRSAAAHQLRPSAAGHLVGRDRDDALRAQGHRTAG